VFGFPVVRKGETIVRPVHIEDVGIGLSNLVADPLASGRTFEFYGPSYRYIDVLDIFMNLTGVSFRVLSLPSYVYR
jgi:hypothetical protein